MIPFHSISSNGRTPLAGNNLLMVVLSCLSWVRYMGSITLYCDETAFKTLDKIGLTKFYSHINTEFLSSLSLNRKYWAAGKILSMGEIGTGAFSVDIDLCIKKTLPIKEDFDVLVAHVEPFNCYLPLESIKLLNGVDYNSCNPLNTSLLYFKNKELQKKYLESFKLHLSRGVGDMVFIEQRLLGMLSSDYKVKTLNPIANGPWVDNEYFTHYWKLKHDKSKEESLRIEILSKIASICKDLNCTDFYKSCRNI